MIVLIDNYDSFVHNLARYARELGHATAVFRNDAVSLDTIAALAPSHIILSPGPCTPDEAGISNAVIAAFGAEIPILGVCLGHQCVAAAFGGRIVRSTRPAHGKASPVQHRGVGIFAGLPNPFLAGRYHSLTVEAESLPGNLEIVAELDDVDDEGGTEIMAIRHRTLPIWGVQFHPESILTPQGRTLLARFLALPRQGASDLREVATPGHVSADRAQTGPARIRVRPRGSQRAEVQP